MAHNLFTCVHLSPQGFTVFQFDDHCAILLSHHFCSYVGLKGQRLLRDLLALSSLMSTFAMCATILRTPNKVVKRGVKGDCSVAERERKRETEKEKARESQRDKEARDHKLFQFRSLQSNKKYLLSRSELTSFGQKGKKCLIAGRRQFLCLFSFYGRLSARETAGFNF